MTDKTSFGDRMKAYEVKDRFMPLLPVVVRIDGKRFSKFTRGMNRPYDERMSAAMREVTCALVEETNARIGYTQSDEITLIYGADDYESQIFMDGRVQKMVSVLASMATGYFAEARREHMPDFKAPVLAFFDARAYNVPNQMEAANAVLWREQDATKNAISMAAQHYFSHKSLQGMNQSQMQERLFQEAGVNFNDYPPFFKRGTFVQRRKYLKVTEYGNVMRSQVHEIPMPKFSMVTNRVDVIFYGKEPVCAE